MSYTAKQVGAAKAELETLLLEQCPGPHLITRHGDGKPAWCWACGRTRSGANAHETQRRSRPDLNKL
jgi:hypothetical protein